MPKTLSVSLTDNIDSSLISLANQTGKTKNHYVDRIILEHIQEMKDIYLAESRLDALEAGYSRTYTLDELEQGFDLED